MTQKVSKVSKVKQVTRPAVLDKQLSTIFGRLHNLYTRNNELWQKVAELEQTNKELRSLVTGGA